MLIMLRVTFFQTALAGVHSGVLGGKNSTKMRKLSQSQSSKTVFSPPVCIFELFITKISPGSNHLLANANSTASENIVALIVP
mmetsp:Transcript_7742/g.13946  ORF Transcript_7742/g.13946 Transcript_7742/m.13946 type:complete len:83 (-) Transcript_7742:690-938(-)